MDFARLYAASTRLRERIYCPMIEGNRIALEQHVVQARKDLGAEALVIAWDVGCSMTTDQAVAYALHV